MARTNSSSRSTLLALGAAITFLVMPVSTSSLPGGLALLPVGASTAEALRYVRVGSGPRLRLPPGARPVYRTNPYSNPLYVRSGSHRLPMPAGVRPVYRTNPYSNPLYARYPRGVSTGVVARPVARPGYTGSYRAPGSGPHYTNRPLTGRVSTGF